MAGQRGVAERLRLHNRQQAGRVMRDQVCVITMPCKALPCSPETPTRCRRPVPGGSLAGFAKLWRAQRFKHWGAGVLAIPPGTKSNLVLTDFAGRPRNAGCNAPGAYSLC